MKPKKTAIPVLGIGIVCLLLQMRLFAQMDEYGRLPGSPVTSCVIACGILAVAAILAVYAVKGADRDYRIPVKLPVQAIGCLAAALSHIYWALTDYDRNVFWILKLVTAVCFVLLAVCRLQRKKIPLAAYAVLGITLFALCFGRYSQWSRQTQLLEYLFPALSGLLCVLYSLELCPVELREANYKRARILNLAALFATVACMYGPMWPYQLGMALWLASGLFVTPGAVRLPQPVQQCMGKLEQAGFTVYAVGGCVRDSLLGLTPSDYDLCTNATPEEMCRIFDGYDLVRAGEKHGTVGVVMDGKVYEITTYRTETGYADNRHPDSVVFVDRVEEDLARRDFTVNAMAYHPKTGCIDPYGGEKDLFAGVLRAVGEPETRFREDSLRILRGVRFACRFRLEVAPETRKAMNKLTPLMENLASERVMSELTQTLCTMEQGDLLRFREVMVQAVPELAPCVGFQQHNPHHAFDVFAHTDRVLCRVPQDPALRWAALLHDVAKPHTFTQDADGKGHFYGHAKESAAIANDVLNRLKASNALQEQVVFLIEHHMDTLTPEKAALRKKLSRYGGDNIRKLVALQQADRDGKRKISSDSTQSEKLLLMLEKLEKEEGRLQLRDLAVNGHDLMEIGFEPGPALGKCQKKLLEMVLSGEIANEKSALLAAAKQMLGNPEM